MNTHDFRKPQSIQFWNKLHLMPVGWSLEPIYLRSLNLFRGNPVQNPWYENEFQLSPTLTRMRSRCEWLFMSYKLLVFTRKPRQVSSPWAMEPVERGRAASWPVKPVAVRAEPERTGPVASCRAAPFLSVHLIWRSAILLLLDHESFQELGLLLTTRG